MSTNNNQNTAKANEINPPESSIAKVGKEEIAVTIPREIIAPNHRRAYAMAYVAGFTGRKLKFVSPIVRNSIARGFLTGERDAAEIAAAQAQAEYAEHMQEVAAIYA